jgi:hypothetical protein
MENAALDERKLESAVGHLGSADFARLERKDSEASRWGLAAFGAGDDLAFPALDAMAPGLLAEPGLMVAAIGAVCVKELGEEGLHWMEQRKLRIMGEKCQSSFEAAQSCLAKGDGAGLSRALELSRANCDSLGEEMRSHSELLEAGSHAELSAEKFEAWAYKSCAEPMIAKAMATGILDNQAALDAGKGWGQEISKLSMETREDFVKESGGKIGLAALGSPVLVEADVPAGVAVPKYKKLWSALKSKFPLATSIADDIAYPALGALGLAGAEPALLIGVVGAICVGSLAMAAKADWESYKIKVAAIHAGESIGRMNKALNSGDKEAFTGALREAVSAGEKVASGLESSGQRMSGLTPEPMDAQAFKRWMERGIAEPALRKAKAEGLIDKSELESFEAAPRPPEKSDRPTTPQASSAASQDCSAAPAMRLQAFRDRKAASVGVEMETKAPKARAP